MNIIGFDPGLKGAIAWIGAEGQLGVHDMPTTTVTVAGKNRSSIYLPTLLGLVEGLRDGFGRSGVVAIVENVHSMPRMSSQSMFTFGFGVGAIHTLLTALNIPFELVTPQRWKKDLLEGTPQDKAAARAVATRLFPGVDLGKRSDEGRADALLIAEWRRRQG